MLWMDYLSVIVFGVDEGFVDVVVEMLAELCRR